IWNINARLDPERCQETLEQCRGAGAVDIIVAKDRHLLLTGNSIGQPRRGFVHVAQSAGIRHQGLDARIEHVWHLLETYCAGRQHAAEQFRQRVGWASGDGYIDRGPLEPFAPLQSADGTLNAKESAVSDLLAYAFAANRPHVPHLAVPWRL